MNNLRNYIYKLYRFRQAVSEALRVAGFEIHTQKETYSRASAYRERSTLKEVEKLLL